MNSKKRNGKLSRRLQKIISEEIDAVLKEQTPEASEDSIFGQYLWADPGKKYDLADRMSGVISGRIRKDSATEPNTKQENDFLSLYFKHIQGYKGDKMGEAIEKYLRPAKQQGLYSGP